MSAQVTQKALKVLSKQRLQPNFGNAGAVKTLIDDATTKAAKRARLPGSSIEIRPEDIVDGGDGETDPLAALDNLYKYATSVFTCGTQVL